MNHKTIITELRRINAWRRGDDTVGQPAPGHFGDVLDAAAILIDQTDARCIEREERIEQMGASWDKAKADLARVTAERDHLKSLVFDGDLNFSNLTDEYEALRARVAELDEKAERYRLTTLRQDATIAELATDGNAATLAANLAIVSKRNAELVAALDDLLGCPTVTDLATCPNGDPSRIDEAPEWQAVLQISCAWTRYKKLKALARVAEVVEAVKEARCA